MAQIGPLCPPPIFDVFPENHDQNWRLKSKKKRNTIYVFNFLNISLYDDDGDDKQNADL